MAKLSKKQKGQAGSVDATKLYGVDEALGIVGTMIDVSGHEDEVAPMDIEDELHQAALFAGAKHLIKGIG